MKGLVSIVIPAYNASKYLKETIDSIIQQTYTHWELIIIDDGSTDDTWQIIQNYQDSRIRSFQQSNSGVSETRNKGYYLSSGPFISFLDADDIWFPNRLEKSVKKLLSDPLLGMIHTSVQLIDGQSNPLKEINRGKEGYLLDSLLLWESCTIPNPSSILLKREVLEDIGLFNPFLSTAADQELYFRIAEKYKIGMLYEVLGYYRVHSQGMHKNIGRMEKDHIAAYQLAEKRGLFKSKDFQARCYANLFYILGNCWWVDGNNKWKGIKFHVKALRTYPLLISRYLKKLSQLGLNRFAKSGS